mmetsp:Transcript_20372/g.64325  ORF Transcript_20372/g.64325 Transcript_20372/m.64325 type:complete len:154 (-) Transcript_20372:261-722(-)
MDALRAAHEQQMGMLRQHLAKQALGAQLEHVAQDQQADHAADAQALKLLRQQLTDELARAEASETAGAPLHAPAEAETPAAPSDNNGSPPAGTAASRAAASGKDPVAQAQQLRQRREELLATGLYTETDALIRRMQGQLADLVHRAAHAAERG